MFNESIEKSKTSGSQPFHRRKQKPLFTSLHFLHMDVIGLADVEVKKPKVPQAPAMPPLQIVEVAAPAADPYLVEPAKDGRSTCKVSKLTIIKAD